MCGRFNVIDTPGLQQLLQDLGIDLKLPTRVNIAPTEPVPLIRSAGCEPRLAPARWWLTPSWAPAVDQKYSMFNARAENLESSRAFRGPFQRQRGIVPMSSFIEWRSDAGGKRPWLIAPGEGAFAAAALWDVWERDGGHLLSCTLVTTEAAPAFAPWHRRMPVVLDAAERERWLDHSRPVAANDPLFAAKLKTPWLLQALPAAVGNSRNKSAELMCGEGETVSLLPD